MRHGYTLFLFAVLPFMGSAQTTLTLQPGPDEGQDACLHGLASEVDNNWGDIDQLAVMAWTFQSVPGVVRSALAFDLSSIPQNATITSAALSLHAYGDGPGFGGNSELSGSNAWWIERITSPWDENTVTWNTQPTTTTLHRMAVEGTDDPDHDYLDLDVTTLVQDMVLDPANSHGFLFKLQTEEYYRRLNFCASEHADAIQRPKLVVTYTVPVSSDTCFVLQPGPLDGQDACLHGLASEVDNNWGDIDQLPVGAWTFQSVPGVVRTALGFDLSSIPENATITSAALSLHAYGDGPGFGGNSELSGSNAWWIERITSPWDENTVTWNTQPTTTTLHRMAVEGTDDPDHDYLDLDVTTLVQDMVLDPANSHGFLFKLQTEEYYRRLNFCASEHADPTKRPQLTVCFSVPSAVAEVAGPGSVLRAFPNPAANSITFDRGVIDGTATITVLDRAGRIVQVLSAATARTQLDVSALADGLYIARVTDGRGTAVATFVVQH